jgi:dTDP-4-amino-4,6-dideoxygalactose transaminase
MKQLHVGRPNIGDRDALMARINQILDNRWLTNNGPLVQEFEARISEYIGVRHCVAVCNATIGLEIAARAIGLTGEVIVPSFTFIATVHALHWQGITPMFVDIDPETHNIDPESIEKHITPKTSGILGVHVWGRPCDTEAIRVIGAKYGLSVMYDAAHAFGCSSKGRMIGGFGRCEVFSFHAAKFLNSFEGGAIVTDDDELAGKLCLMRNFGFKGFDNVIYPGINGKMPEVCAAMGLTSFEAINRIVEINRRNYETYLHCLEGIPGVSIIPYDESEHNNYQYVVAEIDPGLTGVPRDAIVESLHANNIIARKYFWPGCHRMEPYCTIQPNAWKHLPNTERTASRVLVLPTGQEVGSDDIEKVCGIIRHVVTCT